MTLTANSLNKKGLPMKSLPPLLLSRNPVGFEILQKSFDRSGGG
jgi:hypothetical protein